MRQMYPLFAQIAPDSSGGIRTISDVWPLLLTIALVLGILVLAFWRFLALAFAFARGNVPRGWQAVEFGSLAVALFVLSALVAWTVWEVWLH